MSQPGDTAAQPSGYKQPSSQAILDVMHAPAVPVPVISPTRNRLLLVTHAKYPSIQHVATPYLRLAGVRVEPASRNRRNTAGGHGIRTYASKFELLHVRDGRTLAVALPGDARATDPVWSASGEHFVFQNVTAAAVELWVGCGETGEVRRVRDVRLNPLLDGEVKWMPDQRRLLVKLVPDGTGPPPKEPAVPPGPIIQESDGRTGQSSTYEARDTLKNKHDEDLFDYYTASQLALVDVSSLAVQPIGQVDRYLSPSASPDGKHLFVRAIRKPYTYLAGFRRFPYDAMVWTLSDLAQVTTSQTTIASLSLADRVPIRGESLGPRQFAWRANAPATLTWVEALDGGDWKVDVEKRDKVMFLEAPFDKEPREVLRTEYRFSGFVWGREPSFAVLIEHDVNRQWERRYIVNVDDERQEPKLIVDISYKERYKYPGDAVLERLPNGVRVMYQVDKAIFFSGEGASIDGDRPFLDRFHLQTLQSSRLFRSSKSVYETFLAFTDASASAFFTLRESPAEPPNVIKHILGPPIDAPAASSALFTSHAVPVTHIPNPTPIVSQIQKRVINYRRADGVSLSFTLHTPPGYQPGTHDRLPTILYAYPRDFASASQAGQVTGSQARFTRLRKHQLLLLAGYAVLDNAAFPIVGDPKRAYDTYLEQLVANARAAVDKAVELGVTDRSRVGVTGHSHGALMTANLLAHAHADSNDSGGGGAMFRAGVATSGAYNKTLTPFGFQNERRTVWEAPEAYRQASTFFFADRLLARPLLLVHGADDANPGTTPMQSSSFYAAVRGNGGTARLVMLPHEPHHYQARESHEHLVYEMLAWFDKYVKGEDGPAAGSSAEPPGPRM